jgi:hypothetical protein
MILSRDCWKGVISVTLRLDITRLLHSPRRPTESRFFKKSFHFPTMSISKEVSGESGVSCCNAVGRRERVKRLRGSGRGICHKNNF